MSRNTAFYCRCGARLVGAERVSHQCPPERWQTCEHLFAEHTSRYDLRCVRCGISSIDPRLTPAGHRDTNQENAGRQMPFTVVGDESVPPGEARVVDASSGKVLGRIVGLGE